jgi:hypothetical protein
MRKMIWKWMGVSLLLLAGFSLTARAQDLPATGFHDISALSGLHADILRLTAMPQVAGNNPACAPDLVVHCTTLSWNASGSAATCLSTSTPACAFSYLAFKGTTSGGESSTAISCPVITATSCVDGPITLTSAQQTFYYTIEAQEVIGLVTTTSLPSNEASVTFPGIPTAPAASTATPH